MKQSKIKKIKIPVIPFTLEEVYSLYHYQAQDELWNRLRVWKASRDYAFIKSLDELIVKDYAGHNRVLSDQEKELKKAYLNWLCVGLESDKFKALDKIRLKDFRNLNSQSKEEYEEEIKDMLTHSGVL